MTDTGPRGTGRLGTFRRLLRDMYRAPLGVKLAMLVIGAYATAAVFAPWLAPCPEAEVVGPSYNPPGPAFWLGTDQIGRDILSRLIFGARNTIGIALAATLLSFAIGVMLGIVAALLGGRFDQALSRLVDVLLSIPTLVFTLLLLAVLGKGTANLILILALLDATRVFRLARAVALNIAVMDYIEAARLRGERSLTIVFSEILPNMLPPLLTEFGIRFCYVFLTISALSFLGVGIQPPTADWGSMVAESKDLISLGVLTPLYAAFAIAALTIAVNLTVDWALLRRRR